MNTPAGPKPGDTRTEVWERLAGRWGAGLLVGLVAIVWLNGLRVPFLLDEEGSIVGNPTLTSLGRALFPPAGGDTVSGRPVLNFSFALNYLVSGYGVWSYHLANILIHLGASLLGFGILRRVFAKAAIPFPDLLALLTAAIWALHPLQTESVTYVVQRAESLMGLFYLLTLYAFLRSTETAHPLRWQIAAVTACALGMATKEVMVSAPLMVLLLDRQMVAGTFREAWIRRKGFYGALAATWLVLLGLLLASMGRGGTAEAGSGNWWPYLLTQCHAIVRYLQLVIWPHPLVFDYGIGLVRDWGEVIPQGILLLALLAATGWALGRRRWLGLAGAFFFAVLAPSSSVVPVITQTIAEHRMYLPLLAVIAVLAAGVLRLLGSRAFVVLVLALPVLGVLTIRRNALYRSELALWEQTVEAYPTSARAHHNYGAALAGAGRLPEAIAQFEEALALWPDYNRAIGSLGQALLAQGETDRGLAQFQELLRRNPDDLEGRLVVAALLERAGRSGEATRYLSEAVQLRPEDPELRNRLGALLIQDGDAESAIGQLEAAIRLQPNESSYHQNLAAAYGLTGRLEEAISEYNRVLALRPESTNARLGLALILRQLGAAAEAEAQLREVLRIDPAQPMARNLLQQWTGQAP